MSQLHCYRQPNSQQLREIENKHNYTKHTTQHKQTALVMNDAKRTKESQKPKTSHLQELLVCATVWPRNGNGSGLFYQNTGKT